MWALSLGGAVLALALTWANEASASSQERGGLLGPLAEPPIEEYFGVPAGGGLTSVERVRGISPEDFDARVRAGRPFIIEDAGDGHPLVGVTCESFHKRFPGAQMRAEYAGGKRETFVSLGSEDWLLKDRLAAPAAEHLTQGETPLSAPYVWHVKDGGHEAPPEVRRAVQREWRPPYFVRGASNLREATESVEFWFARRGGAVLAHADTYCIPAVSFQLTGKKHWRLMPPPPFNSLTKRYNSHDGGLYGTGLWQPVYEATLGEGEAIVFFPNIFHETYIPQSGPECTVAVTFQFQLPVPVRYIRAYLPTHTLSHLYHEGHCKDLWHSYATLRAPDAVEPVMNETQVAEEAALLLLQSDGDGDGALVAAEIEAYLASQQPPWASWFLTEDYFYDFRPAPDEKEVMSKEILHGRAEDTLHYHDVDGNGVVSKDELLAGLLQWHVTHARLRHLEALQQQRAPKKAIRAAEQGFRDMYPQGRGHLGPGGPPRGTPSGATAAEL